MIGKISELLLSGDSRGVFTEVATSPRGPFEINIQSPTGMKNYDVGGVGLGIVAALEKSSHYGCEVLTKYAISCPRSNRSTPIPVCDPVRNCNKDSFEESDMDSLENYTYVTCHHGPNKQPITRVYCDKGEEYVKSGKQFDRRCKKSSIFSVSPGRCGEDVRVMPREDFLSSCHLCKKKLYGKDIFMYRGEKAFCSGECRERVIMMDEGKELCRSEASRSTDISNSDYTREQIFSPSILAI